MEYPEDIFDIIFSHIEKIEDLINYSLVNKTFYEKYHKDLQKYKLKLCINKDYRETYHLLDKYEYDIQSEYMKEVIKKSIKTIPNIWKNNIAALYDMRYIFEIMYRYELEDEVIKNLNIHFFIHFYKIIKSCIVRGERRITINNINKSSILTSLKRNFKIKENRHSSVNDSDWIYLIE